MKRILKSAIFVALLSSGACVQPELTRRYWTRVASNKAPDERTVASLFVTKQPAGGATPFVASLSDRGQKALIETLGKQVNGGDLIDQLVEGSNSAPAAIIDRTTFKRRLVFSVGRDLTAARPKPGDRIDALELQITLNEREGRFVSISRVETEYGTVDLGKVTLTQGSEIGTSLKATPGIAVTAGVIIDGKIPVEGSANAKYTRNLSEEVALRQRYEVLSPQIVEGGRCLRIIREGAVGIDLAGSFVIDCSIAAADRSPHHVIQVAGGLFEKGQPKPPGGFSYAFRPLLAPSGPVTGTLRGKYRLRRVLANDHTIIEGDDATAYRLGRLSIAKDDESSKGTDSTTGTFEVIGKDDAREQGSTWLLQMDGSPIHVKDARSKEDPPLLQFASLTDAEAMRKWIKGGSAPNLGLDAHTVFYVFDKSKNDFRPMDAAEVYDLETGINTGDQTATVGSKPSRAATGSVRLPASGATGEIKTLSPRSPPP